MANKRCQFLRLTGIRKFLDHITGISREPSMQLKSLDLDCAFLMSRHLLKLKIIMDLCPALKMLTLRSSYSDQLVGTIRASLPKLEYLQLVGQDYTMMYSIQQDEYVATITVKTSATRLQSLDRFMYPNLKVLSFDCLHDLQDPLQSSLNHLLRNCPRLTAFDVRLPLEHFCSLVHMFQELFRSLDPTNSVSGTKRCLRIRSLATEHSVEMVIPWVGHTLGANTAVEVKMMGPKASNRHLELIFREYGSFIKVLLANDTLDDGLVGSLLKSDQGNGSIIENLTIDPSSLTDARLVEAILQRCMPRKEVALAFSCLEKDEHLTQMHDVLMHVGRKTTRLILHGRGKPSEWFMNITVSRSGLWDVRHLEIAFEGRVRMDERSMKRLLALISTPGTAGTTGAATTSDGHRRQTTLTRSILPLQTFRLTDCELLTEDWNTVLTTMDLKMMQRLSFEGTNFGTEQFDLLIEQLNKLLERSKSAMSSRGGLYQENRSRWC
ncbi:hypothetical protein EMPS_03823 [Entomortierella parvispora]|uniref:Uncharacterized protein n=1 Tax=Entomortierella parvispora TaxID=205924 RepID=A0A9P3H7Z5_9FUNG|nr:hypothetical protein EMPS_03823 [Entomortierella parvispora]